MPWDPLVLNDYIRIRLKSTFVNNPDLGTYENLFDYKVTAVGVANDGYDAAHDRFLLDIIPFLTPAVSSQISFVGHSITRLKPPQTQSQKNYTMAIAGTDPGTSEPATVAAQINRQSLAKGPRGNGKLFVFGVPNNSYSEGIANAVYMATLNTLASKLTGTMTHVSGYIFEPHVLHYDRATKTWDDAGLIEQVSVNPVLTSLISRRGGRGS